MLDGTSIWAYSSESLLKNLIFVSTIGSLLCAQMTKGVIYILNGYRAKKRELVTVFVWRTGGMPSSHAAVVSALCASVFFVEGLLSNLFIFSVCFALLVLRDAMGVRRLTGQLAERLNNLGKQVSEKTGLDFRPVKEIQGHTPLEVVIGVILGVVVTVALRLFL
ncbi:MAG: divergent PAP2 family protein [Treponema sp.]|jgi:acid phosphatase family membrane protein YuiD|nr:divergent PAP2 family protein [Treponema sp.]